VEPEKVHPLDEENGVGEFGELLLPIKGDLIQIFRIEPKTEGGVVISVKICFQGMVDHIHPLDEDILPPDIVLFVARVELMHRGQELLFKLGVFDKVELVGIEFVFKGLAKFCRKFGMATKVFLDMF
jgi:hypothetical protein